ncbi:MAG: sigma 54-interacting transcriptional regulator [Nitrospiraceae bacterium]|nr:sigma 54-interacting transcriptional regulator [Nitrospiraceae bacterium]
MKKTALHTVTALVSNALGKSRTSEDLLNNLRAEAKRLRLPDAEHKAAPGLYIVHYLSDEAIPKSLKKDHFLKYFKRVFRSLDEIEYVTLFAFGFYNFRELAQEYDRRLFSALVDSDESLLIAGDTGTGKERFANMIHWLSEKPSDKLISINCAAIPKDLLESELFGFEKGAFSGATASKKGLIEEADSGTLFLDELGKMDPYLQAKILRVIEEKSLRRLGSNKDIAVSFRVLAATQPKSINDILPDLLYRLNYPVYKIELPPLNERLKRPDAIGSLCGAYDTTLDKMNLGTAFSRHLPPGSISVLLRHNYEGNYRELESIIRFAVRHAQSYKRTEVLPDDIVPFLSRPATTAAAPIADENNFDMIPLKDIFDYADKVRAEIVEKKVRRVLATGVKIDYSLKTEGYKKQPQAFKKRFKNYTGKTIRAIS